MWRHLTQIFVLLTFLTLTISCQHKAAKVQWEQQPVDTELPYQGLVVETACGECQFGLPGNNCGLAVRIDGKAYYLDGTGIDDHGDAHADDGFCNAVRQARVQGRINNDRFLATYFTLLSGGNK